MVRNNDNIEFLKRFLNKKCGQFFVNFDMKKYINNHSSLCFDIGIPSGNFTFEIVNKEQKRFLDVLNIRNCSTKMKFEIFRKDTHTDRYIPNNLYYSRQHNIAN